VTDEQTARDDGAPRPEAKADSGGEQHARVRRLLGPFYWLRHRYCSTRPTPPEDAEPSTRKLWRDGWPRILRCVADNAYPVTWDPPDRFPQSVATLHERLATSDESLADELLADAERLFDEASARVEGVERRATTLQGTVAIAAAVALTGGGLILDLSKIRGDDWRTAFAVGLAALVVLLVMTAFRATGASARTFNFTSPSDDLIFQRAKADSAADAKTRRAAYLLHGYGRNNEAAALKVGYLRSAAAWFRAALLVLVALTAMLVAYTVDTGGPDSASPATSSTSHRGKATVTPTATVTTTPTSTRQAPAKREPSPTATGTPSQPSPSPSP
jgi:hypothetical protein